MASEEDCTVTAATHTASLSLSSLNDAGRKWGGGFPRAEGKPRAAQRTAPAGVSSSNFAERVGAGAPVYFAAVMGYRYSLSSVSTKNLKICMKTGYVRFLSSLSILV